jgi:hypothetical protein
MSANGKSRRRLHDYLAELERFCRGQDFNLAGVWESLAHGPTLTLEGGAAVRPLTPTVLLVRRENAGGDTYGFLPYAAARDLRVVAYEPELRWRTA